VRPFAVAGARRLGQELRERVVDLERANREIAELNSSLQRRIDERPPS